MNARRLAAPLLVCLAVSLAGGIYPAQGLAARLPSVRLGTNLKEMRVDGVARAIDVAPVIRHDRMYVPVRHLADALGAAIEYDAADRKVTLTLNTTVIELWIGQAVARVHGQERPIDPADARITPIISENRTMLPLRFVAESLGAQVTWHAEDGTVSLASPAAPGVSTEDEDAAPVRAGWYRVSGTIRDARTKAALAGVQVVARTHYAAAAGAAGAAAAPGGTAASLPEPAVAPAVGAPAAGAPAEALPAAGPPDAAAPATGAVQRGSGPRALGAPGRPDVPNDQPAAGGDAPAVPGVGASPPVYEFKAETGEDGGFRLDLPAGAAHRISLTRACFAAQDFLVSGSTRRDVDFEPLTPPFSAPLAASAYRVYGQVQDQDGRPVAGACVAATSPVGFAQPANLAGPAVTTYMTDATGNYFVDWPAWQPIKVKATGSGCDGKGLALVWTAPRSSAGEGGPRNAGPGYSPEPVPQYLDIPKSPMVVRDVGVICMPPPSELPLAATLAAGETGTTVCQQSAGTDPGFVRLTATHSAITTGQSVDLTASPVGERSSPVLLRWWLDDPKGGTLYVSGCKATFVAPASLGLAYQTSAFVLVAKEGDRKPYSGSVTGGGTGFHRIMMYDPRSGPGGGQAGGQGSGCTTVTYSVTAHAKHGDITRLDIQGVGTWRSAGAGTLTVNGVPVGRYTVRVTTTGTGTHTLQVQIGCPVTRSYID